MKKEKRKTYSRSSRGKKELLQTLTNSGPAFVFSGNKQLSTTRWCFTLCQESPLLTHALSNPILIWTRAQIVKLGRRLVIKINDILHSSEILWRKCRSLREISKETLEKFSKNFEDVYSVK